ncbi:hypothetical protein NHX12_004627 [Muraenolepis orangiensis]|uniref:SAP domain-containing protein n=1 Tax=Muraenolepis orangiensis TaxID=630683 RepID=A0A9Q0DXF6_9TELE|nr:hypothetical protein NHX12_004627 [Muraenolepis orangiensis]
MADLEDVTLDGRPLNSLRVADLKAALEERGLSKSGPKNALVKRLKGALMLENLQRTSTPHSGLQPNSQIGEEMSQNSFIKQYLAKQQELLRQRLEREAREAVDTEDQEDNTSVNNSAPCPASSQEAAPAPVDHHKALGPADGEGLAGPAHQEANMSGQPSAAAPGPMYGSAAERVPSASQALADSDDEDSDEGDDEGDDEEWGARRRGQGEPTRRTAARRSAGRERSEASRQPPQHRKPPGPLTLLARKMASEGAFSGAGWHGRDGATGEPTDNGAALAAASGGNQGVLGGLGSQGPMSVLRATAAEDGEAQLEREKALELERRERQRMAEEEQERALAQERQRALEREGIERQKALEQERRLERELALVKEREERERALQLEKLELERAVLREREERERALQREREERERALQRERALELAREKERLEKEEKERIEREKALEQERLEREKALAREREENERLGRERALEQERILRERALEQERLQREEKERLERQKALEQERVEREKALEHERVEREAAHERERMEKAEVERKRLEVQEREEKERAETLRLEKALEKEREERALKEKKEREEERAEALRRERERALEKEREEKERALKEEMERALKKEREEKERALEKEREEKERALKKEREQREEKERALKKEREQREEKERVLKKERDEKEREEKERALKEQREQREEKEMALKKEREEKALEKEREERERVLKKEREEKAREKEREEEKNALERKKLQREKEAQEERDKAKMADRERESHLPPSKRGRDIGLNLLSTPPQFPPQSQLLTAAGGKADQPESQVAGEKGPGESSEQATLLSPQSSLKKFRFLRETPVEQPPAASSGSVVIKRPRTFSDTPPPHASPVTSPTKMRPWAEKEGPALPPPAKAPGEEKAASEDRPKAESAVKSKPQAIAAPTKKATEVEEGTAPSSLKGAALRRQKDDDKKKQGKSERRRLVFWRDLEYGSCLENKKAQRKASPKRRADKPPANETPKAAHATAEGGVSGAKIHSEALCEAASQPALARTRGSLFAAIWLLRRGTTRLIAFMCRNFDDIATRERSGDAKESSMAESEHVQEMSTEETPKAFAARRISLGSSKVSPGPAPADGDGESGSGRKRRWGSSAAVTAKKPSISITTESLKSLIPDIKQCAGQEEAVVDLHPEEAVLSGAEDEEEEKREPSDQDLQIRRTVTQVVPAESQENGQKESKRSRQEEPQEKEVQKGDQDRTKAHEEEKKTKTDASVSGAMETQSPTHTGPDVEMNTVTPSGEALVGRALSQQRPGVSITIDDPVRSARQASPPRSKVSSIVHVSNLVRPFTLGQLKELLGRTGTLVDQGFWIDKIKSHCYVTYSSPDEAGATRTALHGVKWPQSNPKVLSVEFCQQDELDFHKGLRPGEKPGAEDQASGPGGRQWTPSSGPPSLLPDRDQERRRKERGKSKERKTDKKEKAAEEPPAKLLDDLFQKTKAAPCIYWLPLTEETFALREAANAERAKERERKRKEQDEAEEKKKEEQRKERVKAGSGPPPPPPPPPGERAAAAVVAVAVAPGERAPRGEADKDREGERERDRDRGRDRGDRERDANKRREAPRRPAAGGGGGSSNNNNNNNAGRGRRSRSRSNPRERRR